MSTANDGSAVRFGRWWWCWRRRRRSTTTRGPTMPTTMYHPRTIILLSVLALISVLLGHVDAAARTKVEESASSRGSAGRQKEAEPVIEEVTAKQLERLLNEKDFVAVYWYARSCTTCDKVLTELEKIDDDTDHFGVDFVKINDKRLAKQYGIKNFPALTYFREKEPIIYDGDLMDEENVLDFLTSLEAMDRPDRIEEVNAKILSKIVEETDFVAVLFCPNTERCAGIGSNKPDCKKCLKALQELENIDDEADQLGIGFVKIADEELADEYNLGPLPVLVYYRHQIPIIYEHELSREEDVLEWLVANKSTGDEEDVIEDVTAKTLNTLIGNIDNLVVLFYDHGDEESMQVLNELEKIDDDCDKHGIQFVKIDDEKAAEEFGIDDLPAIVYFEKQIPNVYDGDIEDEDEILEWLLSQLEKDEIEDVTDEMLDRLIKDGKTIAVLFYDNNDRKSQRVLNELENIDDECDQLGVTFVKIDNAEEAKEYGIQKVPTMLYFEKGIPMMYEGNLEDEEKVLKWLEQQQKADQIEDVTDEMLDMVIDKMPHVAVLFYDKDQKKSQKVLSELENIDDDCDQHNIAFVKISDLDEAKEYGIDTLPTLVLFERKIPHIYDGDLMNEDQILGWLLHQKKHAEIPEVTDEMVEKLIETSPYIAVLFYDKDDKQDMRILNELENIDDDLEKEGIIIVRIDNDAEAKEYGIDHLPTLVYFEDKIPAIYEGDLLNEDEVLEWLIEQKNTATIEEVTDEILTDLIEDHEYVVVYFSGSCDEGEKCDNILEDLENIDDELDETGIIFVTTEDTTIAKKYGIRHFPTLAFFRNKDPLIYTGDLDDEDEVLSWITDEDTLEIPGKIEEVNARMLENILDENDYVVVFFYKEGDKKSQKILQELENIDDECEEKEIDFVKISDEGIEKEYDLPGLPALAFYRHKFRQIYSGDMMHEEEILEWVLELRTTTPDVIESVDRKTLQVLINDVEHLAVFFYDDKCETCADILEELETIDDDTDKHGIQFVKSNDAKLAAEIGVFSFPALVYYETGVPIMYDGNLLDETEVLEWMVKQKTDESIEEIDRETLIKYIETKEFLAVIFYKEEDPESPRVLRHIELIDDEAAEYGIKIVRMKDRLVAKKYGFRNPPGITYFRKGKSINYDGDIDDEEEILDWLTNPENMELTDHIERINKKMFQKVRQTTDYLAVFFYSNDCKQCGRVLAEIEHIDDEADSAGIKFVKIDDKQLSKQYGVFALPAILFFKMGSKEPVIYAGDLYDEEQILQWLMTQKDPSGEVIEAREGEDLLNLIRESESLAIYFWNRTLCDVCQSKTYRKQMRHKEQRTAEHAETAEHLDDPDDCAQCVGILEELENIDDDCDRHGITFVKTQDFKVAEDYGVTDLPVLVYFEHQVPNVFAGDLSVEEEVLQWLITQRTEDRIELITRAMLETSVEETQYLAVYFTKPNCHICEEILEGLEKIDDECDVFGIHMVKIEDTQLAKRYSIKTFPALVYFRNGNPLLFEDDEDCPECDDIMEALEKIDGEADLFGIDFVKISSSEAAEKYSILNVPSLVYFRKKTPLIYDGDLTQEDKILQWLTSQDVFEIKNEIEEVNRKMLDKLLDENEFLAVFFYEHDSPESEEANEKLEEIDDETDNLDITFVKMADPRYARKWGVTKLPAIVYFRKRFPSIYRGDLHKGQDVLEWLRKNRYRQPELNIYMYMLIAITILFLMYTGFLLSCFRSEPTAPVVHPKQA
ncbi:PREDICTED: uncharacterized protein LOC108756796 isoform X4 [Trachymyrmex septentrionalis]|uniref:uncharacterized protein LOC108756796 isoform X4 n=1 Tax=Trachymyrmex septentrionalis TaxID=34720 RepID=UPI00084F6AD2|nr:PREDICTED: uncharacterized protein LOC108756796 isoform X4 [Trachymyrmex septentrionalis]